jgi:DNA-binding Lrp family transcriptional regulator
MEEAAYEFGSRFNERYSLVARKIVRMLSENSRISNTEIAEKLGVTRQAIAKRLDKLEREFGIDYTLELNEEALGLVHPHIIMVKFEKKPDYKSMKKLFQSSHIPQFVATVKGGYDLFIYANSASRSEYAHWDKGTQVLLSEYKASWYPSEIAYNQFGFFPIRNETIDKLDIDARYKEIIKLLNTDSRASFRGMSKKLDMHFNVLIYNFKKLLETNYIRRFTIVEKPVMDTVMMYYFAKLTLTDLFERCAANARKALIYDDPYPLMSRYSFCSQLIGSGDFFTLGVFDNRKIGYDGGVLYYKNAMLTQKVKISYGVIDKVLVGRMPLRSTDNAKEYRVLNWTPETGSGMKPTRI